MNERAFSDFLGKRLARAGYGGISGLEQARLRVGNMHKNIPREGNVVRVDVSGRMK